MNRSETRYSRALEADRIAGLIDWWDFEPITLRLATGARYTPDFAVLVGGALEFHEVKGGFIREAAMVRLKVAASKYPFPFVLVRVSKGQISREVVPA